MSALSFYVAPITSCGELEVGAHSIYVAGLQAYPP